MITEMAPDSDRRALEQLNQEYVAAFMNADVEWYRKHLADEFVCIDSDGSVLQKHQFLANTAKGPDVADYKLEHVDVRVYGEVGLVRATGLWTSKSGSMGLSRYLDVYVKQHGEWKTVSAQITRAAKVGLRGPYKRSLLE